MEDHIFYLYFYLKNLFENKLIITVLKNILSVFLKQDLKFSYAFALGYFPNSVFSGVISMVQWIQKQLGIHRY